MINWEAASPRVRTSAGAASNIGCFDLCDLKAAAATAATGTISSEMTSESETDINSPHQLQHQRRVKFLCSFGGSILPRPYDGKLRYVGGETRIVRVNRDISFQDLVLKMAEFYDAPFTIKYQLPEEEDLDSLVSVLSDDDVANMMEEYDKLEAADGFTRLRVFLFSASEHNDVVSSVCIEADVDQRFVDALNGLPESTCGTDPRKQQAEFVLRNESFNSLNCVIPDSGSIPRRIPHTRLPNSPRQQELIHVASPPSPLNHPHSPFSVKFEESSSDLYHQGQQPWTVGSHLRVQDSMPPSPSMVTRGCAFQESVSSEVVLGHKYNHCMKVFPSNEGYCANSPETESPRDVNRIEIANHWPEDSHKPIPGPDILSHQVNMHQQHLLQQQNMHLVHQAVFHNTEVASSPRRNHAIQPVKYSRMCEPLEANKAQHLHEKNKAQHLNEKNKAQGGRIGEGLGRNEMHHTSSAGELDRYSESQKHMQGVWSHDRGKYECRLDYGSTQSSGQFQPLNSLPNDSSHLSSGRNVKQHCQPSVTGENLVFTGRNMSHGRFERISAIENPHESQFAYEARSSTMYLEHPSYYQDQHGSGRLEFQVHKPHSAIKEGSPIQNASIRVDQLPSSIDQLPSSIDQLQTDTGYRDRINRARDWVLHSTDYQRDMPRIPFAVESSGIPATEEGILRDGCQNFYSEHESRWLKPDVSYHDTTFTDLYNHATCDQLESSTHCSHNIPHMMMKNHFETDLAIHLGSLDGQNQWCYSSGEERSQEVACLQRNTVNTEMQQIDTEIMEMRQINAENLEMQQCSYTSYETNAVGVHNLPGAYMSNDLLHNETAIISKYGGDVPKEFHPDSSSETTKEIQGIKPLTVSSHYQVHGQLGGLTEQVPDTIVNLESNGIISDSACSHTITSSRVFLPESLTLLSSLEVLSSALSSAGPPVYDQSPVSSTKITGPKELLYENGREKQFKESEKSELKDFGRGQLTEKLVSNKEVAKDENLEKGKLEKCLNDRSEADASRKSSNVKSPGQSPILSDSVTTSITNIEGKQAQVTSMKEEDCKDVKQVSVFLGSNIKDGLPEKTTPEENPSRLEDSISGFLNIGKNNASFSEADAVSQGLQTIRNDDLEEVRELGSGTYGTVYYGKWKGSDVAIKRIKASCFTGNPSEQERMIAEFWKEACMLGKLHHPNVVTFYGVVRDGPDGTLATVTEYMVNGSLKQVLNKKDRTIDRRKRLIIARDVAFGMEYLHEKNIVHFDLKCDNLLVNMKDPHRPICKIGDLGLSKIKQRTLVSGGIRGTLPWMAPELLSEGRMVTEKVDVYSFGIVMWELLTGEEPYANMNYAELIGGIIDNTLRPTIPDWCREPAWRSLMERCWSHDPGQRPSFSEIATELRAMGEAMNIK